MIDIHCHILSGVDDGARDMSVTDHMLKTAAADGIDSIICTPHSHSGTDLEKPFEKAAELARKYEIALYPGTEHLYNHLPPVGGRFCTLAGTSFLLVEFVSSLFPPSAGELFFSLQKAGFQIIIAHPERRLDNITHCEELNRLGVFFQLNADSILGSNGSACRHMAESMIRSGFCHYIASDAHGRRRTFHLTQCRKKLEKSYGKAYCSSIMDRNPQRLLADQLPETVIPEKRGLFSGLFKKE